MLDISPLLDLGLVKILSQSVGGLFCLIDSIFCPTEALQGSKIQVTADAGKDVEKEEHSSIAGGIESLYNHSGNQYGSFSENWT